jgi:hypothetical protein
MATTIRQIKEALEKNDALISQSAKSLGISRQALSRRIHKNAELEAFLEDVRESTLDIAEGALFKAIRGGKAWAICFYLKCKGKRRGYIEKQELDLSTKEDLPKLSEEDRQLFREAARYVSRKVVSREIARHEKLENPS